MDCRSKITEVSATATRTASSALEEQAELMRAQTQELVSRNTKVESLTGELRTCEATLEAERAMHAETVEENIALRDEVVELRMARPASSGGVDASNGSPAREGRRRSMDSGTGMSLGERRPLPSTSVQRGLEHGRVRLYAICTLLCLQRVLSLLSLCLCLSVSLSVSLSVCLSLSLSVSLSVSLSLSLSLSF